MPVFGFLASLAAPLIRPAASMAWEGIKKVGRDLFTSGKEQLKEVGKKTIKTLGQSITDKATTIGQIKPQLNESPIIQTNEVDDKIIPTLDVIRDQQYLPYTQQRFSQNQYPAFTQQQTFKQQYQNIPNRSFSNTIDRVSGLYSQNNQQYQSAPLFNQTNQYLNSDQFHDNLRLQRQQAQNINLNYKSGFEREEDDELEDELYAQPRKQFKLT